MKNRRLENQPIKLTKENLAEINSFDQLLDLRYGKAGADLRNEFDAKVEALIGAEKGNVYEKKQV